MSSCDAFLNVFQSHGLKPEMICPCASSPEAMTVAIRRYLLYSFKQEVPIMNGPLWVYRCTLPFFLCVFRPGAQGAPLPARAILSMAGLSHGVIRVNTEDKNSALTVQDVGHVMPGGETLCQHFCADRVSMLRRFNYHHKNKKAFSFLGI